MASSRLGTAAVGAGRRTRQWMRWIIAPVRRQRCREVCIRPVVSGCGLGAHAGNEDAGSTCGDGRAVDGG